jgi:hypothetical protein
MCNEQLQIRLREAASLVGETCLEVACDAFGLGDNDVRVVGRQDFFRGFGEESEPAVEVTGLERKLKVGHHGIALIAACGEHDGGPEVLEQAR